MVLFAVRVPRKEYTRVQSTDEYVLGSLLLRKLGARDLYWFEQQDREYGRGMYYQYEYVAAGDRQKAATGTATGLRGSGPS